MQKVLITGGAGYLAGHIRARLQPDYVLTLFDRAPVAAGFRTIIGDITDPDAVLAACQGQDAAARQCRVVHTVALVRGRADKPAGMFADVVVKGTWVLLEACAAQRVSRVVNISSIIADGMPSARSRPYAVGDPPRYAKGDLFYCVSKKLAETLGNAYVQAHDLSVIHLRPGVIDGDGANPPLTRSPEGVSQPWFIHVDPRDVAQAVESARQSRCASRTDVRSGTYHIVAGRGDSARQSRSLFDWWTAAREMGYDPRHNRPSIPEVCQHAGQVGPATAQGAD